MGVTFYTSDHQHVTSWLVPNKQLGNLPEEKLQGNNWPPRLPGNQLHPLEESRNPTDTDQEPSPFVRSEDTKSPPSFSSENCRSSVWLSEPCRRPSRPTSSGSSRTPTCAPSTPSVSPSCPRTFSLLVESEERELKMITGKQLA